MEYQRPRRPGLQVWKFPKRAGVWLDGWLGGRAGAPRTRPLRSGWERIQQDRGLRERAESEPVRKVGARPGVSGAERLPHSPGRRQQQQQQHQQERGPAWLGAATGRKFAIPTAGSRAGRGAAGGQPRRAEGRGSPAPRGPPWRVQKRRRRGAAPGRGWDWGWGWGWVGAGQGAGSGLPPSAACLLAEPPPEPPHPLPAPPQPRAELCLPSYSRAAAAAPDSESPCCIFLPGLRAPRTGLLRPLRPLPAARAGPSDGRGGTRRLRGPGPGGGARRVGEKGWRAGAMRAASC